MTTVRSLWGARSAVGGFRSLHSPPNDGRFAPVSAVEIFLAILKADIACARPQGRSASQGPPHSFVLAQRYFLTFNVVERPKRRASSSDRGPTLIFDKLVPLGRHWRMVTSIW